MADDDEPPFPADGLRAAIEPLSILTARLGLVGIVELQITVSPEGKPIEYRLYQIPDQQAAQAVVYVFSQLKFKPARCGGQPCKMDFPFKTLLRAE